jgi:hypothetical protein
MNKAARIFGYLGAIAILLSAAMHEFAGWPALQAELAKARTPAPLAEGLAMVWHFAGLAMLLLAGLLFFVLRGGRPVRAPFLLVGLGYALFGVAELALTRDPFPLTFVVPGVLLLVGAALERR